MVVVVVVVVVVVDVANHVNNDNPNKRDDEYRPHNYIISKSSLFH